MKWHHHMTIVDDPGPTYLFMPFYGEQHRDVYIWRLRPGIYITIHVLKERYVLIRWLLKYWYEYMSWHTDPSEWLEEMFVVLHTSNILYSIYNECCVVLMSNCDHIQSCIYEYHLPPEKNHLIQDFEDLFLVEHFVSIFLSLAM